MKGTEEREFDKPLGLGKVSREILRRSVFPFIPLAEEPSLDGGAVQLRGRTVVAHSPSIGVPLESLGFFAFHYAASNVACLFATPKHLITGIYMPLRTKESDLRIMARSLGEEARRFGVEIAAGQTATYYGLEIPMITSTCLGTAMRQPLKPVRGDRVVIMGAIGNEALWLKGISEGISDESWRGFTPLPIILRLQKVEGVKLMHDVSEGGIKGAVLEITEAINLGIDISSKDLPYALGVEGLGQDVLRIPTYGTLIAIVDPNAVEDVSLACANMGVKCVDVGIVTSRAVPVVDGVEIEETGRIEIDELYGSFRPSDEVIDSLREALNSLEQDKQAYKIIPQVGTNMVYAKPWASSIEEVAGLSGRVVVSLGRPKVCGEIVYGGSIHMASVALSAMKLDPAARAAVNIRGGEEIEKVLLKMGLEVIEMPDTTTEDACPVATYIKHDGRLHEAYVHPGAFGIEPTTTIIGKTPGELLKVLLELAGRV